MRAGLVAAEQRSVQGRRIYIRDMPNPLGSIRVLVVGGMHGDELSSTALALQWIEQAQSTGSDVHWRFIPMLNPDGLFAKPSRRTNAHGVDLNRNFPTPNWKSEAAFYWEQRTRRDPRRWPGPHPLSEPESRYLDAQMREFKPQLIVSIHAPYGLLDYDGPSTPPPKLGRLYLDQVGIFPGSLGNYGGIQQGMPVVTIELPNALQAPGEAVDHAGELGDAHHPAVGQIADVGLADHRQHVVLAEADEADVPQDDQLVIAADLLEGALEIAPRVGLVAREQLNVRARHAGRRVQQAFTGDIVPRPADQGAHSLFGFVLARAGVELAAPCARGDLTGHIAVFFEVVVSVHLQRFPIMHRRGAFSPFGVRWRLLRKSQGAGREIASSRLLDEAVEHALLA
jgi:hypothetical protein